MDWHGPSMASEVIFRDPGEVFTRKRGVEHCAAVLRSLYFTFTATSVYSSEQITQHIDHLSHVSMSLFSLLLKSSWNHHKEVVDLFADISAEICTGWSSVADWGTGPMHCTINVRCQCTVHTVHLNTGSYIGGQRVNTNCNTNKIFSVQLSSRSHKTKDLQRCNAAKRTHSPLNLNIHTTGGVSFK